MDQHLWLQWDKFVSIEYIKVCIVDASKIVIRITKAWKTIQETIQCEHNTHSGPKPEGYLRHPQNKVEEHLQTDTDRQLP